MDGCSWLFMDEFWFRVKFIYRDGSHAAKVVHLVGDFCGWKQLETLRMTCCEEGYTVTLPLQEGFYQYKFLVDGEWVQDANNPHRGGCFDNSLMFVHMDPGVYGLRPQHPPHRDYHRAGSDGSHFQVLSPLLPEELASRGILQRLVFVYLPPSYHSSSDRRYPVVYAHDGQNLFSTPELCGGPCRGGWYLDAKLDHYWDQQILPEFILVAVPNSDYVCIGNRAREYCTGSLSDAQGDPFVRYLIDVVKTEIDSKYRTLPDSRNTITLGASMGGLLAFTLAFSHPSVFTCSICMSPSFWYVDQNNMTAYDLVTPLESAHAKTGSKVSGAATISNTLDSILNVSSVSTLEPAAAISPTVSYVESTLDIKNTASTFNVSDPVHLGGGRVSGPLVPHCRVYIDSGDGEGDNMFETREMQQVLLQNGWAAEKDFLYHLDECRERVDFGITHSESVWRDRVLEAFKFAFGRDS